jgi:hypothetical protein
MNTTVGPIQSPRVEDSLYRQLAVWSTKKAAAEWAVAHGWTARDVFKILAGTQNMTFTQWALRDAAGMALTEAGYRQLEDAAKSPAMTA